MKQVVLYLTFALFPLPCFGETQGERDKHPIIGGTQLQEGEAPWLAWVVVPENDGQGTSCTGSLIDPYWVLTAAHCFDEASGVPTLIKFGEAIGTGLTRSSKTIHLHPSYDFHTYDVALVELDEPVHLDPIPLSLLDPGSNTPVTLMGFGEDETGRSPVSIARKGEANTILWSFCADLFPIRAEQICVGSGAYIEGGDSGSPLLVQTEQGNWNQIGVNHTHASHSLGHFSIATKVLAINEWISGYTSIPRDEDPEDPNMDDQGTPIMFQDSVSKQWVIPTSVNASGRFGGVFKTALVLFNPNREGEISIISKLYGPRGFVKEKVIKIDSFSYRVYRDFLGRVFDYQGGGAVELSSEQSFSLSKVEVWIDTDSGRNTTTVSPLPSPLRPYSTPSVTFGVTVNDNYRTNVGVFNASFSSQTITVSVHKPGETLQEIEFNLPAKSWSQKSISAQVENGFVIWDFPNGGLPYYPYIVEVDNVSQDGTLAYPIPLSN